MPRFAANLAYLFTERPFIERFGAAAAAGFKAVELQFPYDHAPSAVRAELARHDLAVLGINTAPGRTDEFGLAALPGREADFAVLFRQALDYVGAIGGPIVLPARSRPSSGPRPRPCSSAISRSPPMRRASRTSPC
jgi:hydroxypyruvate isomerase